MPPLVCFDNIQTTIFCQILYHYGYPTTVRICCTIQPLNLLRTPPKTFLKSMFLLFEHAKVGTMCMLTNNPNPSRNNNHDNVEFSTLHKNFATKIIFIEVFSG